MHPIRLASLTVLFAASAHAADWTNLGGNSCRNGLTSAIGPESLEIRWSGGPSSSIAWNPSIEGDRIFVVRQTAFVPNGVPNDSRVYALDVATGGTLWTFACPYEAGDWTTNVYGVRDGRVYVGRGGNGNSVSAPVYCLDAATGGILWVSAQEVATGAYDGVVFTAEGDPIFATNTYVRRVSRLDGSTVWNSARNCSVSGDCGPALSGNAVYVDEVAPGGQVLTRFDADTGARLYSSPVMPGFLSQNTPLCAPDGLVFYPRTQSNPIVDFFYAFRDTGTGFEQLWNAPALAGAGSNHGITADGGVLMLGIDGRLEKRDQVSGTLLASTVDPVTANFTQSHVLVDGVGRIFYGNGGFPGTVYSFDPDLSLRWSVSVANLNQGGPTLAADGTLVIAGVGGDLRAYRTESACAPADLDCDGIVGPADLALLLGAWGTKSADLDGDGTVGPSDLAILLGAWATKG